MKYSNGLSILGFGCMRFPNDSQKAEEMIVTAVRRGINYFDTAYIYPGSEATLGNILEKNALREKVNIATKLPVVLCRKTSDFDKYFYRQLERLRTDYIDYYHIHMLTDPERWNDLCGLGITEWIKNKKSEGKIKRIGFSFHGGRQDFLKLLEVYDWEFCLIQYNYSDENFQAGVTGLKKAHEKGLPVFIMEPLLGGALAGGLQPEAVKIFKDADSGRTPAVWALKWLWNQPEINVVLSGMSSFEQVEENIEAAESSFPGMLTEKELNAFAAVKNVFNESFRIKCTGCNYCAPCPAGVDINSCFSAYNAFYKRGRFAGMRQYYMSTGALSPKRHFASLCTKCGKCEKQCPQNLEIIKSLGQVKQKMEPFWTKPFLWIGRAFTSR